MSISRSIPIHGASGRRPDPRLAGARRLTRLEWIVRSALAAAALASATPAVAGEEPAPAPAEEHASRIDARQSGGALAVTIRGASSAVDEETRTALAAPRRERNVGRTVGEDPYDREMDAGG